MHYSIERMKIDSADPSNAFTKDSLAKDSFTKDGLQK
jgi:hypothetical protein